MTIRPRSLSSIVAALAAAVSLACGAPPEADSTALAPASALRTTALSDQFNAHDSSVWEMANWANGNPFNCGFLPDHVTFANGAMRLRLDNVPSAGKQYSGGEYRTKDTFSYGRYETRMIAAKGSGTVSSFFTYTGTPWDEIDFEILGKNTFQAQLNYFVNGVGGHERIIDLGFDASAGYHTYAIDWQPNSISWYVDGVLKHTVTGSPSTLPSHPMQIMMNLWNGIGVDGWLGPFTYSGPLTASYDYVTYTPPGATGHALTVAKAGNGGGTVTSNPSGISCGGTCSATYASGATVTLSASPAAGSTFGGWSGACTGTGSCIVTLTAAATVTATFDGTPQQGGPVSIDAGGRATGSFVADVNYSGGNTSSTTSAIDTSLVSGTVPPQAVFQTERWGEFSYTIPGLTAGSPYTVTLYFAEIYWSAAGRRTFNVSVNGAPVLTAFDVFAAAGGARKAIARSFQTTANGNGQIVIQFTRGGGVDNPTLAGLAVAAGGVSTGYTLAVNKAGTGSGTVAGGPIDCGAACTAADLASGTTVTLTATPASGSTFAGWSGACVGTGSCVVSMTAARTVTATFDTSGNTGSCTSISGGQSGNFNTTGAVCFTVSTTILGWGCANATGRTVTVNGSPVSCGQMPLPGGAPYTFSFSAGTYPWASFYWW